MDILKISIEWARDEVFSARFFIFFAILFLSASLGFWQLGKTEMAKAYIIPTLVAGVLILAVGVGIFFTNKSRIHSFAESYNESPTEFVRSEMVRTEKSMGEFRVVVFKVIPFIIVAAALMIIFVDSPVWRAISITTITLMVCILLVDSNANARIEAYHKQLELVEIQPRD